MEKNSTKICEEKKRQKYYHIQELVTNYQCSGNEIVYGMKAIFYFLTIFFIVLCLKLYSLLKRYVFAFLYYFE